MPRPPLRLCSFENAHGWEKVSGDIAYANPHIQVELASCRTPSRSQPVEWSIARRKPGVAIAARDALGNFLLIRQERIPLHRTLWEFPAGQIDVPGTPPAPETIYSALEAELVQETGYHITADTTITPLGFYFSSQGFTDEHVYLFLADHVTEAPDHNERIHECRAFPADDIRAMIRDHVLTDGNSLALFARLVAEGML